jgi:hypothetical protein
VLKDKKCKQILESDGNKYSNEEAQLITGFLLKLAENTVNNIKSPINEKSNNNGSGIER